MNKRNISMILTLGVFGIINMEMGVVGILPLLSEHFSVSISQAGWFVSLFALAVAVSGPIMPLLLSGMNRKRMMVLVLFLFVISSLVQAETNNFYVALSARILPAFFHPVYISMALSVAAASVPEKEAPGAVAKVMIGVSAGMVLGVPVVSLIANTFSLQAGMLTFAAINGMVLLATLFLIPPMQATEKLTYGEQLAVLKLPIVWLSLAAVVCINGSIFGVYSYFTEYLSKVTRMSPQVVSIILLVYGLANMVGNCMAGKGLSRNPIRFSGLFPMFLVAVYLVLFLMGTMTIPTAALTLVWGILAGAAGNINQYWITSVMQKAPDFGNGLFLAATNLGTTLATALCGLIIANLGIRSVIWGGIGLILFGFLLIWIRICKVTNHKVQSMGSI